MIRGPGRHEQPQDVCCLLCTPRSAVRRGVEMNNFACEMKTLPVKYYPVLY